MDIKLVEKIQEDVFKGISKEEADRRLEEYNKKAVERALKKANAVWTEDGYVCEEDLDLSGLRLTKLPKIVYVGGNFDCAYNKLETLEGAPKEVGGDFYCFGNLLKSLAGCPEWVGRDFYCSYNKLESLKGCPEKVEGDFYCRGNPRYFTEEDIRAVCKVGGKIYTGR